MNKHEARRRARAMVAHLVRSARAEGWPIYSEVYDEEGWMTDDGVLTPDGRRIVAALDEMARS